MFQKDRLFLFSEYDMKFGHDLIDILYLPGNLSVGDGEDENDDADQVAKTVP